MSKLGTRQQTKGVVFEGVASASYPNPTELIYSTLGTREQRNGIAFAGIASETYVDASGILRGVFHNSVQVLNHIHNGHIVVTHYHNGVLVQGGTLPVAPEVASNSVTISNPTASTVTNAPIRIGQQFKEGEIANYPIGRMGGTVFTTQANVKTRWPDGSVKHAILSFLLPSIEAAASIEINFVNFANGNNTPLTKSEMLGSRFDFDAVMDIDLYDGNNPVISARDMLEADHYELWNEGQVATTVILRDYSPTKTYALGHDANTSLWPAFEVTFWNAINTVEVRYIMESPDTETLQDESYDISLSLGVSSPEVVYTKSEFYHRGFARWTKKYWSTAQAELDRDIGFRQNIDANAFPNYDTSLSIAEADIASYYADWLTEDRDIGDIGKWTTRMGNTGGREDIGPITTWNVRWLFDGDHRHREIALAQADLAGNWPMHIREGREGWHFDLAETIDNYGKQLTINPGGRTGHWATYVKMAATSVDEEYRIPELQTTLNSVTYYAFQCDTVVSIPIGTPVKYTPGIGDVVETTIKAIIETGNIFIISFQDIIEPEIGDTFEKDIGNGWESSGTSFSSERQQNWSTDSSHYPNYSSAVYFVEGDYYYLEQMVFDAAVIVGDGNPNDPEIAGRGRTADDGRLSGTQTRGLAWRLNIRLYAEDVLPDAHYFKPYLARLNKNAIAFLAGELSLSNPYSTHTDRTDMFNHGLNIVQPTRYPTMVAPGPLGSVKEGGYAIYPDRFDLAIVGGATAPWQHNYLITALGRAKELGYPVDELISYIGQPVYTIWGYTEARISRYVIAAYVMAVVDVDDNWLVDKAAVYDAYLPSYVDELEDYVVNGADDSISTGHRYDIQSRAAASFLTGQANGSNMWQWYIDNVNFKPQFNINPKFALNPREAPAVPPVEVIPASNIITLSNPTGAIVTNAPIRIGQQFKSGEIIRYPVGRIAEVILDTQANVKTRWTDGSVKHAIISFILPSIDDGESIEIDFIDAADGNNTPLTKDEMLNARFDFDAVMDIDLYDGNNPVISARDMLEADHYELWNEGQVATTVILRDYSPTKTYAIGHDVNKSLWPAFEVTFWNDIDTIEVRYIMESPNTETLQDESYDISLKMGNISQVEVYTKSEFYHRGFSRWTKKYWNNTQAELDRDIGFRQNIEANAFANYDTSLNILEADIADYYATWLTKDRDIGENGKWTTSMGASGGREDIGPMTTWNCRWLMDGDHRHREIALTQADLAGQWPINVREGREGWHFDLAELVNNYGKILTINPGGRYTHWSKYDQLDGSDVDADHRIYELQDTLNTFNYAAYRFDNIISIPVDTPIKYTSSSSAVIETTVKAVIQTGNYFIISFYKQFYPEVGETFEMDIGSGWVASNTNYIERYATWAADTAHYPVYSSGVYFVEGDHYYLEQMLNDTYYVVGDANPKSVIVSGRGRTAVDGRLPGSQTRGLAWSFTIRTGTQDCLPDGHYYKDYITRLNENAVTFLAGEFNLPNPYPEDTDKTDMYNHAVNIVMPNRYPYAFAAGPIGYARDGSGYAIDASTYDVYSVSQAVAPWQHNYLIYSMGRAKELGHRTDDILDYIGQHIYTIWDYTANEVARELVAAYTTPALDLDSNWLTNKKEVNDSYNPDYITDRVAYVALDTKSLGAGERYDVQSRAAASFLTHATNGTAMWQWYEDTINSKVAYSVNPKFALNPRT